MRLLSRSLRTFLKPYAPLIGAAAVLAAVWSGLVPDYWVSLLNYIAISSLVAIGLVLLTGVGGMTSFGQAAFVGFGAYTSAALTTSLGVSPWLALPVSLAVTLAGAFVIGAVTVRLAGHFLPLGTLAWGMAFSYLFGNLALLGGHDGMTGIPPLRIGTHAITDGREYFVVVWIAVVAIVVATRNLLDSRIGRAIRALRRGAVAAESFGVEPARVKLVVFLYSALLAGLAGWLYAHFQRSVSPGPFGVTSGIEYLLMAVVGGAGRIYGGILGSATVTILRDQLQNISPWLVGTTGNFETIVFGAILVLGLQLAPDGLWPILAGPPPPPKPPPSSGIDSRARREPPAGAEPLLSVRAVTKRFGGLVAVNEVSFQVNNREIVGVIGPNGAGKSTLFNLVTGILKPTAGEISFRGEEIHLRTPRAIASRGVSRTFQHAHLVGDMSVIENVAFGAHLRGHAGMAQSVARLDRAEEGLLLRIAAQQLDRVGLGAEASKPAGNLALGQMRLVEIARALSSDPLLLLLDEPAAGLRLGEKRALARLLRELRQEGLSILLVEHDMDFVMSLADRLVVLDFGAKIAEGVPTSVRQDPKVVEAYLGGVL